MICKKKNGGAILVAATSLAFAAAPALGADAKAYWHFSGAFHPAVAHFPIALLVVAGVVELWRALRGKKLPGDAGYTCLILGTLGAVVAAVLGWANAEHGGEFNGTQAQVLALHRWLGVGVAVVSIVVSVLATRARRASENSPGGRWGLLIGLLLCAGLVGLTGSYGGKLTFGVDYYESYYNETVGKADAADAPALAGNPAPTAGQGDNERAKDKQATPGRPDKADSQSAAEKSGSVDAPRPAPPAGNNSTSTEPSPAATAAENTAADTSLARVSYVTHIKPIFAAQCFKCHGEGKQKGDYRMDTRQHAFEPGASGDAPIVPGKAEDSLLVKVIEGKGEYKENMMPPKGTILSPQQVALVRRWIDEGAVWDE